MKRLAALVSAPVLLGALAMSGPAAGDNKKTAPEVPPRKGKSETIQLFNGKDLKGWHGYKEYWSVEDGVVVGKNDKPVKVSTYLVTDRKFTDFRLTATVKLVKSEMHSGIAFWGRVGPDVVPPGLRKEKVKYTYGGHLVMFPSGWGMYDLFGRNGLPVSGEPAKKVGKQHDWNRLEILAQGNRVRVAVNGTAVVDWRDPEPDRIKEGPIGLQLHSNDVPQEVHFKDLVLTTFPEPKLLTVGLFNKSKAQAARAQANVLLTAVKAYTIDHGQAPASLDALLEKDDRGGPYLRDAEALTDPWGLRYQYNPLGGDGSQPEVWTITPNAEKISSKR
jgi:hypothetical protein